MTPAQRATCAAEHDDDLARLRADLIDHPESPTLNRLALSDPDGRVVGCSLSADPLALAWAHGAPAALVVEAENLKAVIGPRCSVGYLRRAVRLAHRVRRVNAALHRYSGAARTLPTVTVVGTPAAHLDTVVADVAALAPTGSSLARRRRIVDDAPPFPVLVAAPDHRGPPRTVARLPLNRCALATAARPIRKAWEPRAA